MSQIQYDVVYAHEQYPSMELENMFSQPYSVQVSNGNDKVLNKHWILWKDLGTAGNPNGFRAVRGLGIRWLAEFQ